MTVCHWNRLYLVFFRKDIYCKEDVQSFKALVKALQIQEPLFVTSQRSGQGSEGQWRRPNTFHISIYVIYIYIESISIIYIIICHVFNVHQSCTGDQQQEMKWHVQNSEMKMFHCNCTVTVTQEIINRNTSDILVPGTFTDKPNQYSVVEVTVT